MKKLNKVLFMVIKKTFLVALIVLSIDDKENKKEIKSLCN